MNHELIFISHIQILVHPLSLSNTENDSLNLHFELNLHRYFIYGLQDAQHLERVRLQFQMFEIHKGEHKDKDKEYVNV